MENTYYELTDDLLATRGQRFANYIVDLIVIYIIAVCILVIFSIISEDFAIWLENMNRLESYMYGAVITIAYYSAIEIPLARSVGKFITGTIVVDEFGQKPDAGTMFKRSLCRVIPFEPFTFIREGARGWHDSIPDVYVVSKAGLESAKRQFHDLKDFGKPEE